MFATEPLRMTLQQTQVAFTVDCLEAVPEAGVRCAAVNNAAKHLCWSIAIHLQLWCATDQLAIVVCKCGV